MKSINLSVLHISTTDNQGGSGRSAYRIHTGLKSTGVRSRMLVGQKTTNDPDVDLISRGALKFADRICGGLLNRMSMQSLFYPSSFAVTGHPWFKEADIVQIYNTHGNYFSHTALPLLSRYKPIVWRLSDMWPVTGHCGYSYDCEKWKKICGECPYIEEYPPLIRDRTAFLWKIKKRTADKIRDMAIVAPSKWIKHVAEESPVLKRFHSSYIPNGIDLQRFKPQEAAGARKSFGISANEKVVLFVSEHIDKDKRKGGDYLVRALSSLDEKIRRDMVLLMIGENDSGPGESLPFRVIKAGYINNDETLVRLYSASDIMALPTLAENLPNTVLESMACGTPVIGFNTGGVSDIISDMNTGYLARLKDEGDLAEGIRLLLTDPGLLNKMKNNCRQLIEDEFTEDKETQSFRDLYEGILH